MAPAVAPKLAAADLPVVTIPVEIPTLEALAPFGTVLASLPSVKPLPIDFYDGTVEVRKPAEMESDSPLDFTVARIQPRDLEVQYVERHPGHRQIFIPLGGKPFVAMLAPPTEGLPKPEDFRAFRFDGSAGLMLYRGVWHEFPFSLEPDTDVIVILSQDTNRSLNADNVIAGEAIGPDLEKLNTRVRWGKRVRLALP
jgi:ureidoglycolate lyase